MNRVKASAVLLTAIFIWSVTGGHILCTTADELIADISEIELLCENNRKSEAVRLSDKLSGKWRKKEKLLSLMAHDDKISNLNFSIARITPFIETDSDELTAEIRSIKHQLEKIKQGEKPYWYNIM